MKSIDLTPTWPQQLNTCLMLLEAGNAEGRKFAKEELKNMAKLAQMYTDIVKAVKANGGTLTVEHIAGHLVPIKK